MICDWWDIHLVLSVVSHLANYPFTQSIHQSIRQLFSYLVSHSLIYIVIYQVGKHVGVLLVTGDRGLGVGQ